MSLTELNSFLKTANLNAHPVSFCLALKDIPSLAHTLGDFLKPGDWVFLDGDLGAGKTLLAKEISLYFKVSAPFTSPTFSLINTDTIKRSTQGIEKILHLDLYRLKSGKELCFIGLEQEFNPHKCIALIEWPDVVDEDEWLSFFEMTLCPKPTRILKIQIENEVLERRYQISFASFPS